MTPTRESSSEALRRRRVWVAVVGCLIGAYGAAISLNARSYLSGYRYGAARHSGIDGVVQRIVDGALAMTAGP